MTFEQSTAPVVEQSIRELTLVELQAVSGGGVILIESVPAEPVASGFLLSE